MLTLFTSSLAYSQVAPTNGKKVLKVKESYKGEYLEQINQDELSQTLIDRMKKTVLKKAKKYGFTDIKILDVGQVYYPSGNANEDLNFKFQANILDNVTGSKFKIRLNTMMHSPKYIIKEPNAEFYCTQIKSEEDKFNGSTTLSSPLDAISFYKIESREGTNYYIRIEVEGITPNINEKNVIILFENGTKINRPNEKIDIKLGENARYRYISTFKLLDDEIEKLKKDKITDVRLFVHDKVIKNGDALMQYLKCISK